MQERAARTRQTVLEAAADEFAERGYEGASLQRVAWRAATSIGALTFHFRNKTALADEVRTTGRDRFGRCLAELAPAADPLRELRTLIATLARLAHEDRFVRAARRLEADPPEGAPPLAETWLPVLRDLLDRAHGAHRLRPGVAPEDAVAMLAHLAEGAMAAHGTPRDAAWDTLWDSVWDVVLHGLAADRGEGDGGDERDGRGDRTDGGDPGDPGEHGGRGDRTDGDDQGVRGARGDRGDRRDADDRGNRGGRAGRGAGDDQGAGGGPGGRGGRAGRGAGDDRGAGDGPGGRGGRRDRGAASGDASPDMTGASRRGRG
ncbi:MULTISPECIES: TetR family transcriptional regulator [unclassified Streptomyces]|uniref:TetR family transcriptional regulator n=1 Tax=unclassified Streptomyces TaxID=2593676 RepID=UPI00039B85FE|nr:MULTISPECIES: TetR family transcriptional regulator [unclassified Streptomyces]